MRSVGFAVTVALLSTVAAAFPDQRSAASLRESYAAMRSELDRSVFEQPLALKSTQQANKLAGDVHAVVDFPFERVKSALGDVRNWCEILILHPNTEQCRIEGATTPPDGTVSIDVGRAQVPVSFTYHVAAADADYLHVQLGAPEGPFGTTDYRIDLEATPLDHAHTILHFAFSHGFGTRARLAMQAYLALFGRDKVGFTVVDRGADGKPRYVRDLRAALERNVMRYYLAIDAYLRSLSVPADRQREARLDAWYAYTKRYALQLHEEPDYLEHKRAQFARQPMSS